MLKNFCAKLNNKGSSLAETLVAVALLSIVFVAVTVGMSTVISIYDKLIMKADALTLISTANTIITADLETAKPPTSSEGGCVLFESGKRGFVMEYLWTGCNVSEVTASNKDSNIYYYVPKGNGTKWLPIVTDATLTKKLGLRMTAFSYDNTAKVFRYTLEVFDIKNDSRVIKTSSFVVKPHAAS